VPASHGPIRDYSIIPPQRIGWAALRIVAAPSPRPFSRRNTGLRAPEADRVLGGAEIFVGNEALLTISCAL
jgi:hypothetical protein